MTSLRERLAQLEEADFDTFGDQDPASGGTVDTELTPDEWVDIRDTIREYTFGDPSLLPDCLVEAVKVMGEIGTSNIPNPSRAAAQLLRDMVYRAKNGCWPREQQEPAWSLDGGRESLITVVSPEKPWETTLGPDEVRD